MNTMNLTVNIYRPDDPDLFTVIDSEGRFIAGFATIGQVADWLARNDGQLTSDPIEVQPDVYERKAQISIPAYRRMVNAQEWAATVRKAAIPFRGEPMPNKEVTVKDYYGV